MPLLLGRVGIIAAILFWLLRRRGTVNGLQAVGRDTRKLQRRPIATVEDIVGPPLQPVREPRLVATILMIQIVRTGSPFTAHEKTRILEFKGTPLRIERISATFERP